MDGHTEQRMTWPRLLPRKKLRCYRQQDPETGSRQIIQVCRPDRPDRISFLSDAIQSLILDSLPLKEVFKTSVLSKKWRHLCYSLPSLRFNSSHFGSAKSQIKMQMKEVIHHVLRDYNAPSIHTLVIALNDHVPHNHMDAWVSFAVSHRVRTFIFKDTLISKDLYTLPSTIFTCASLKILKLAYIHINFPTDMIFLPSLIYLEINNCCFTNAVFSTSNYPMLGKLVIRYCRYDTLSISSSVLHYLQINQSVGNPKVNLLSVPSLSSLGYLGEDPPNICLETLLPLQFVYFDIKTDQFRSWDLVRKMLKGLLSVRELRVGAFYLECLRLNWGSHLLDYPCFSSVRYLRLVYSGKRHVPVFKVLLRSYPNLVFLETCCRLDTTEDDNNTARYWEEKEKETLPANFLNGLVTYEAIYGGQEDGLVVIKFVVENAIALRNIKIFVGAKLAISEENLRRKVKTFSQTPSQLNVVIISRDSK